MTEKLASRIIDANLNRAKEGLRVCEEIARFILNDTPLTARFRSVRHLLEPQAALFFTKKELLQGRDSKNDVGRPICGGELSRKGIGDIFYANIQRVKESLRVLEEFGKLRNTRAALKIKDLRYRIYEIEKSTAVRIAALCRHR